MLTKDKFGVNVHTASAAYSGSTNIAKLVTFLNTVGLRWVRDNNPNGASVLAAAGYTGKVHWCCDDGTIASAKNKAKIAIDGGAWAIELVNEPPLASESSATTHTFNEALAQYVSSYASSVGKSIDILSTAWIQPVTATGLTNAQTVGLATGTTYGSVHAYRGNTTQSVWNSTKAKQYSTLQYLAPYRPFNITETGWHDYLTAGTYTPSDANGHNWKKKYDANDNVIGIQDSGKAPSHVPTPDSLAATQIIQDSTDEFEDDYNGFGCTRAYFYEARDEAGVGTAFPMYDVNGNALGTTGRYYDYNSEGYFGLARKDWTLKAHTIVLKDYLAAHGNEEWGSNPNPNPNPTPGKLRILVGGFTPSTVVGMKVKIDGDIKDISAMKIKTNGVTRTIWTDSD